jgi:hypothetical protein
MGVSTLHTTKVHSLDGNNFGHRNFSCDIIQGALKKILLGIFGYWALLFKASSRSARLQGLLEVGPVRLLEAMLGDLGISTLRSIKTMT